MNTKEFIKKVSENYNESASVLELKLEILKNSILSKENFKTMKSKFGNIIKNTKLNVNDIPQTNCTCEEDCKLKIEENQNQNQTIKHPLKEGESSNIEENRSQIDLEDTNVNIIIMKEDIIPINLISNSYNKSTIADLLQKNLEEEDNEDHECERDRNHNDNKYGNDLHKKKRLTQKIMTNSDNEDDSD